jgi:hypothetical protein
MPSRPIDHIAQRLAALEGFDQLRDIARRRQQNAHAPPSAMRATMGAEAGGRASPIR